ncbi:MAG: T9SS type A sorting domain-containing protein [candidate division WOR-3 bacterium]|nr:MAG: T9SS type A sorting domain-containing protein [candidate division WOR-3 bacterium]
MRVMSLIFVVITINTLSWGGALVISDADSSQEYTSVSYGNTRYFAVWQDFRNGNYDVYGARVSQEAIVLDPGGIAISSDTSAARTPAIAFDGNNYLTVWRDNRNSPRSDIYGARINQEGQILDPDGFAVSTNPHTQKEPAIAFGSTNYLVVWEDNRVQPSTFYTGIYCARVDPQGTVLDTSGICISFYGYRDQRNPAVAFDGANYLVVWQDERYDMDIYGARVSQNGEVLDFGGFPISNNIFPESPEGDPSIAFDGTNYLVVWHVLYEGAEESNIYGARVTPDALVLDTQPIPISTEYGYQLYPAVTFDGKQYIVTWHDQRSGSDYDIYGARVTAAGTVLDPSGFAVNHGQHDHIFPDVASSGAGQIMIAWQYEADDTCDILGSLFDTYASSDDSLALAYTGNRHLVRAAQGEDLHLVYTNHGNICYTYSSNGGANWTLPTTIGEGILPAIALDSYNRPSVAWTDNEGGLWYKRQDSPTGWSYTYHIWDPYYDDLKINSPPSIAIDHLSTPNIVHILVTRSGGLPTREIYHTVEDYTFNITLPQYGSFIVIEQTQSTSQYPPLRSYPSIARCEVDNSFHAVWQRVDTICYASKAPNQSWNTWGWQFYTDGLQSTHPFVETYGDSIFVVWQHREPSTQKEEVYRGTRHRTEHRWRWRDLSLTLNLVSLHPVNASGLFTAYAEEPILQSPHEIYYKGRPEDERTLISNTAYTSLYPQCAARFTQRSYLYTAWQDGDAAPYEIRFKKMEHVATDDMAYLSSANGNDPPSPYLVARDSFISDWQIPVDVGNATATYEFPLIQGYAYKAKAVIYHQGSGPWRGRIKIDNSLQFVVTYHANVPETLECWIPPALYEDSVLSISFDRIAGDFAAIGPIYIYRYENDVGGGGPMSQQSQPMHNTSLTVFPNPFTEHLNIVYQTTGQHNARLEIYDVTGRLVKSLYHESGIMNRESFFVWDGIDDHGRTVPQGVYFLRIDNSDTGDIISQKVLRIR